MRLALCSWTALEYLRKLSHAAPRRGRPLRDGRTFSWPRSVKVSSLRDFCHTEPSLRTFGLLEGTADRKIVVWIKDDGASLSINPLPLAMPIHAMVAGGIHVASTKLATFHSWSEPLPSGCFWPAGASALRSTSRQSARPRGKDYGGDVLVATPELVFVQIAEALSSGIDKDRRACLPAEKRRSKRDAALVRLILLGMELCGSYATAPSGASWKSGETVYGRVPLTSVEKISTFMQRLTAAHRPVLATEALKWLANNSASPMETALYLLLCLPRKLGGYGFPKPVLNRRIAVGKRFQSITGRRFFVPDLFWKDAGLDVEYDSDEFHDAEDSFTDTMVRDNALKTMDVQSRSVTRQIIESTELLHRVALQSARVLGVRIRPAGDSFRASRALLRSLVLPPDMRYEE